MPIPFFEIVGLIGVAQILLAYFLLQVERIKSNDLAYLILNATGSICVLFSLYFRFNLSAFVVEFSWLLISLLGLSKLAWQGKDRIPPQLNQGEEN